MSYATFEPEEISRDDRGVALAAATIFCTWLFWQALFYLLPALDPVHMHLGYPAEPIVYLALYLGSGLILLHVLVRPLRAAVGIQPFTRFFGTILGLTVSAASISFIWRNLPAIEAPTLIGAFGGVLIAAMCGYPRERHLPRAAFMGCLVSAALAWCFLMKHHHDLGLAAALFAVASGAIWMVSRTGVQGLLSLLAYQIADAWMIAQGDIIKHVITIALCLLAFFGAGPLDRVFPGLIKDWQFVFITAACAWFFVRSLFRLVGVAYGLLTSLIPSDRPDLSFVARQKVHGDAGYAGTVQVDAALRDQDLGPTPPRFRD